MNNARAAAIYAKPLNPARLLCQFCAIAFAVAAVRIDNVMAADQPLVTAPGEIEEIIVTAEKRRESINDVPMSISAITRDQLQQTGLNTAPTLHTLSSRLH